MDKYHYINLDVQYNGVLFVQYCRMSLHLFSVNSSCAVFFFFLQIWNVQMSHY